MASSTLLSGPQRPFFKCSFLSPLRVHQKPNTNPTFPPKFSIFACSSFSWEREEQLWLREEQRWLREESRWRWERESLLVQIAALRHRIEAKERQRPPEAASVAPPLLAEETELKEMILEVDRVRVSEDDGDKKVERKATLRMGSEGEEVRAVQEALHRLGFYSGEEDIEFSSFSSGTERAVKTWQASLGAPEDGIITSELLERLLFGGSLKEYTKQGTDSGSAAKVSGTNGAPGPPVTKIAEIQQTVIKETGDEEVEVSDHKVFLLGENRWEEQSRLRNRNKPAGGSKAVSATKCLTCHGEGLLNCTECDGSGEPNIEPQFLEWLGEDSKCPYCEGLGFTICDDCQGNKATGQT